MSTGLDVASVWDRRSSPFKRRRQDASLGGHVAVSRRVSASVARSAHG